ncbi:hypothetical protein C8R43DRAFT_946793 [Mycena crocata]|nr:hypothetical protein C8R43DRAFT_946793 [Mycena crocata]
MEKDANSAPSSLSPHAAAQAKYRAKNANVEKEKAKLRMQRLRQARKEQALLSTAKAPAEKQSADVKGPDYHDTHEFKEFRVYMDTLVPVFIDVEDNMPGQLEEWEKFLASNPCTVDLEPFEDSWIEHMWADRDFTFPEWREELADFRDFMDETTPEARAELLKLRRADSVSPRLIQPPGGF